MRDFLANNLFAVSSLSFLLVSYLYVLTVEKATASRDPDGPWWWAAMLLVMCLFIVLFPMVNGLTDLRVWRFGPGMQLIQSIFASFVWCFVLFVCGIAIRLWQTDKLTFNGKKVCC